jgi:hypothetical protein
MSVPSIIMFFLMIYVGLPVVVRFRKLSRLSLDRAWIEMADLDPGAKVTLQKIRTDLSQLGFASRGIWENVDEDPARPSGIPPRFGESYYHTEGGSECSVEIAKRIPQRLSHTIEFFDIHPDSGTVTTELSDRVFVPAPSNRSDRVQLDPHVALKDAWIAHQVRAARCPGTAAPREREAYLTWSNERQQLTEQALVSAGDLVACGSGTHRFSLRFACHTVWAMLPPLRQIHRRQRNKRSQEVRRNAIGAAFPR